jgi:hypothetical protein
VPKDAVIESLSRIVFLSDRNFHQPTLAVQDAAVRFVRMSQPYPPDFYSMEFKILNTRARSVWQDDTTYADWLKSGRSHVASIGGYDLLME